MSGIKRFIEVTSCKAPDYWYSGVIGKIFEVIEEGCRINQYQVKRPIGDNWFIHSFDAKIVDRQNRVITNKDFEWIENGWSVINLEGTVMSNGFLTESEAQRFTKEAYCGYYEGCEILPPKSS